MSDIQQVWLVIGWLEASIPLCEKAFTDRIAAREYIQRRRKESPDYKAWQTVGVDLVVEGDNAS